MLRSIMVTSLVVSACASSGPVDDLAGESQADDAVDGKADSAVDGAYTYFEIWRDQRKCASPMCGGFFVARLNRSYTVCGDHVARGACYSPSLDWTEASIADELQPKLLDAANIDATSDGVHSIVRGRVAPDRFVVTEAWVEEGDAVSDGVFVRAKTNSIECITAPCPTITEKALNTSRSANIAAIEWSCANLSDREVESLTADVSTDSGVILAGDRYTVTENGHRAKGRTATAVYQQIK